MGVREKWYFLSDAGYFIGYDGETRHLIGIVDSAGFHTETSSVKPFPPKSNLIYQGFEDGGFFIRTPTEILAINLINRTVTPFYHLGDAKVIGSQPFGFDTQNPEFFILGLTDHMVVLDKSAKQIFTTPYAFDIDKWRSIGIATDRSQNRFFFDYRAGFMPKDEKPLPDHLVETDIEGKTLHSYELEQQYTPPKTNWLRLGQIATSSPLILGVLRGSVVGGYSYLIFPFPYGSTSEILLLGAGTFILALLTLSICRRQRRNWRETIMWTVIIGLFGLPGLLTFRLASDWPTRQPCPNCRAKRPIENALCPSCSTSWPFPAITGAEIFEKLPDELLGGAMPGPSARSML